MKFVESFNSLGYTLINKRGYWSAENKTGVCITIWQDELIPNATEPSSFDLWKLHGGEVRPFTKQSGHAKRIRHLQKAMDSFHGRVHVIIVEAKKPTPKSGETGRRCKNAEIWVPKKKGDFWQIKDFCSETGYFSAEVVNS